MKKIIAVLLVSFFAFSAFEIYVKPELSKSCCCSSAAMCRCKHNGNECPLKGHAKADAAERHEGAPLIKLQGCGSGNSPAISPQFHKDLFLNTYFRQPLKLASDSLITNNSAHYNFLPTFSIDHPPKSGLSV